ncbi:hypothetical protein [Tsuneonella aeria]
MTGGSIRLLYARSDEIVVRRLGPDHALLTGRFTGRYRTGAHDVSFVERYSSVWRRHGTRWRLRHEHSSFVPEPATERSGALPAQRDISGGSMSAFHPLLGHSCICERNWKADRRLLKQSECVANHIFGR